MKNLFLISNAEAIYIAEEVIHKHAAKILEVLGLSKDNDGILERIMVDLTPITKEDCAGGQFKHMLITKGFLGTGGTEYAYGSGSILIRHTAPFVFQKKNGKVSRLALTRLRILKRIVRDEFIFILAHELRHYWQFYTGEIFRRGGRIGVINFMPYSMRWEERDANEFAKQYMRSIYGR